MSERQGRMLRATCPHCHRSIPGGRIRDRRGYVIMLRRHNGNDGQPCPGSRQEVEMDS